MMQDIAALQYLYGANFEGDDSRYTFSPQTGEMFINGKGQGKPVGKRIFRTIWDGGGKDIYDFSNYSRNLIIDLNPGGWSDLDAGGNRQKAILQGEGNGGVKYAGGHVYNALKYKNDPRSLIESAIGGSKHDQITGNRIGNNIYGNEGNDEINGKGGRDYLEGVLSKAILPGRGEKDILTGGAGQDTFSLGSAEKLFYSDRNPFTSGRKDYALITDFTAGDKIQLFGQVADYHLKPNDSVGSPAATGFGLYRNDGFGLGATAGLDASDEFIALIQIRDGSGLSLTNYSQFTYLS